jgi:hypothetical protein
MILNIQIEHFGIFVIFHKNWFTAEKRGKLSPKGINS